MEAEGEEEILTGPERRCVVTGQVQPKAELLRFVVGPTGEVVPDIERKLPGRGIWLSPRRDVVNTAVAKRAFSRAARRPVTAPEDLADRVEGLLARRALECLALARRAGQAVCGFEKVKAALDGGTVAVLVEARDGSRAGQAKLTPKAGGAMQVRLFDAADLGLIFGRDHAVHVGVAAGGLADRLKELARLLAGFREE
ncbi:conserved hypothetical protein [Magnetospirillum sp. LM-5]|uniref:RNA-binding protein n=1 Tax=Magnetospirillum sp. LM-5 TaxID=2681466 RepID=UPI001380B42A|nr:RNA-binding protein [Magnetospirillum sp. LM-5]CAA7619199.1 conserved hypothetical protein [Magnetospirillum sp. LM-5]